MCIETIQKDLMELEPKDFYFKYIVKSSNWYFSDYLGYSERELMEKMDSFKEIVSKRLGVNFHNVQIVGSAKVGFSLSPTKLFTPFHEEAPDKAASDIDIAIISDKLFHYYWDRLRTSKRTYYLQEYYGRLAKSIFKGFINDKELTKIKGISEEWEDQIRPVNISLQDDLGFIHPISYRVYRSWEDLEEYQINSIRKAKRLLEDNINV